MPVIHSSIACNVDSNILSAALPLFEAEAVQAIEWSFDALLLGNPIPDWFDELLNAFSQENRLVGHGVFFSIFSGNWSPEQQQWLSQLKTLCSRYRFNHITEHFGFMTGTDFHKGAPIGIPFTPATLALGQDRLKRIQAACLCPVGLENLAFAYSLDEVKQHGDFLRQLVEAVNGFIILDLHNLYCQAENFAIDPVALLQLYPLDIVREIHISGGSWEPSTHNAQQRVRRDTHDDRVPTAVFTLLEQALGQCPQVKFVVLEQIGSGLASAESQQQFQRDFLTMNQVVSRHSKPDLEDSFLPLQPLRLPTPPLEDWRLYQQQRELATILETATNYQDAQVQLRASGLAHSDWGVERWHPAMLDTAIAIAQKWKHGFQA